ncbi:unnamed protein product [Eruca vesicaria subsp. sativa]|uniref:Uncharacterized protein n=1 Tax=Eruca vesicaria subsp. sativa TaxID=29727 RepID=A0ABC8J4M1_ERUVS|nr:unnamed protein product [Eruca vesicaria subsp. sativa]
MRMIVLFALLKYDLEFNDEQMGFNLVKPSWFHHGFFNLFGELVGARAVLARSASFQALQFGLINVDCDYSMLVVTYSGIGLKISHGSPLVEQAYLVNFVYLLFCYCVLLYVVHQTVEDSSVYYPFIFEHSSGCNRLNSF